MESRLAFATTEEVRNETQYFKDASFHYQLSQAEEKYRGALLLIHNRATSTLTEQQSSSINDFETIVKTILQNIEDKLDFARVFAKQAEKSGHREVVEWWTKLIHMGEKLMSRAEEILGKIDTLKEKCPDHFVKLLQSTLKKKGKVQRKAQRKNVKRLATATDIRTLMSPPISFRIPRIPCSLYKLL